MLPLQAAASFPAALGHAGPWEGTDGEATSWGDAALMLPETGTVLPDIAAGRSSFRGVARLFLVLPSSALMSPPQNR